MQDDCTSRARRRTRPVGERFWAKVRKDENGCWLWTARKSGHGYGQFSISRRWYAAHRVAYEWLVGPIPDGMQLDHLCRVRACVNPAHLEPVTCSENLRRGIGQRLNNPNTHKTYCKRGHPLDEGNTYRRPEGHRDCRTCERERHQRRRARLHLAARAAPVPAAPALTQEGRHE